MSRTYAVVAAIIAMLLAAVFVQKIKLTSTKEQLAKLKTRAEIAAETNKQATTIIKRLQAVNEQCVLDKVTSSKLNEAMKQEHQVHIVQIEKKLNETKQKLQSLGDKHCANTKLGDAVSLFK